MPMRCDLRVSWNAFIRRVRATFIKSWWKYPIAPLYVAFDSMKHSVLNYAAIL
jgi:hypothetical protein